MNSSVAQTAKKISVLLIVSVGATLTVAAQAANPIPSLTNGVTGDFARSAAYCQGQGIPNRKEVFTFSADGLRVESRFDIAGFPEGTPNRTCDRIENYARSESSVVDVGNGFRENFRLTARDGTLTCRDDQGHLTLEASAPRLGPQSEASFIGDRATGTFDVAHARFCDGGRFRAYLTHVPKAAE